MNRRLLLSLPFVVPGVAVAGALLLKAKEALPFRLPIEPQDKVRSVLPGVYDVTYTGPRSRAIEFARASTEDGATVTVTLDVSSR